MSEIEHDFDSDQLLSGILSGDKLREYKQWEKKDFLN